MSFLDLKTIGNIYNTQFTQPNGGGFPDNNSANDMYESLTNQFNGIRDINDVNNVFFTNWY